MEKIVYALFDTHDQAAKAVDDLIGHGVPDEVLGVVMHEGALHEDDIPTPGSKAKRFAAAGGVAVGTAAALLGGLVAGQGGLVGAGMLATVAFSGGAGTLLGAVVTAIAGAAEARPEIKRLAGDIKAGKVLVTVDVTKKRARVEVETLLERHGAHHIGTT